MPVANFSESVVVYDDVVNASNPQRKHVDWKRTATGLTFDQVYSERFVMAPGTSGTIGSVVGVADLSATPVNFLAAAGKPTWYQARGAFPTSPWALAIAVGAQNVTVTAQASGGILLSGAGLGALVGIQPGDWVYLAGSSYGDAGAFAAANQGFWVVTTISTGLYLSRVYAEDPVPVTETVVTVGIADIQHLPDSTRPRWAFLRGSSIFGGLKSVVTAAIGWVAFATEAQFAPMNAVTLSRFVLAPGYMAYVRVETDQPLLLSVGALAASNEIDLLPALNGSPAWYEAFAFITNLVLTNNGNLTASINLIYADVAQSGS
jgi:hypothetical protein